MDSVLYRRLFFKKSVTECLSYLGTLRGRPHFRLNDLWRLNPATLGRIRPRIRKEVSVVVDGNRVLARTEAAAEPVFLFVMSPAASRAFNLFDAGHPIHAIAGELRAEFGLGENESFGFVRDFFLDMVRKGACIPANAVGKREWLDDDGESDKLK
jgi:hypothetical protein